MPQNQITADDKIRLREFAACGIVPHRRDGATWYSEPERNGGKADSDRYRSLLFQLAYIDVNPVCDQLVDIDTECVGFPSAYVEVLAHLTRLTRGQLELKEVVDALDETNELVVSFTFRGSRHHWRPKDGASSDWLDLTVVEWLEFLLQSVQKIKERLHFRYYHPGGQNVVIGCFTDREFEHLRKITGLVWGTFPAADASAVRPEKRPEKAKTPARKAEKKRAKKRKKRATGETVDYASLWAVRFQNPESINLMHHFIRKNDGRNVLTTLCAEGDMLHGLEIYWSGTHEVDANIFFRRVLDKAVRSRRLRNGIAKQRAVGIWRAGCYAEAILGKPLDVARLLDAASEFDKESSTSWWDDYSQMQRLTAARCCLIAGDVARAAAMFRKKFTYFKRESSLLNLLVAGLSSSPPVLRPKVVERFRSFFDCARHPRGLPFAYIDHELVALEYALIWYKYVVSPDGTIDWPEAMALVTA